MKTESKRTGALLGITLALFACGGHDDEHESGAGGSAGGGKGGNGGGNVATGGAASGSAGKSESNAGDTGNAGDTSGDAGAPDSAGSAGVGGAAGVGVGGRPGHGDAGLGGDTSSGVGGSTGHAGDAGAAEGGGTNEPDCTGTFGNERVLLTGAEGVAILYPSLPADELEIFFSQSASPGQRFFHALRPAHDAEFGEPTAVSELDAACGSGQSRTISLSADGLRAYVVCYSSAEFTTPPLLHVARRPTRDGVFVYDATTYGSVGPAAAVTLDELTLLSSSETSAVGSSPPREYTRSSTSEPFTNGQTIVPDPDPQGHYLSAPSLARDGVTLFGTLFQSVAVTTRLAPGQPFAPPVVLFASTANVVYGSPEVSADCRTLYYGRIETNSSSVSTWTIRSSSR